MNTECDFKNKLGDYLDGELSAHEKAQMEEHFLMCGQCREATGKFRIGVAAVKAFLEAEGKSSDGPSLAPQIMSRVRSESRHFVPKKLAVAFAAALALIFLFIDDISPVKSPNMEFGKSASIVKNGGYLLVQVQADRLDVEDRVDGITRKVAVRP